jgi:hypothetical protein
VVRVARSVVRGAAVGLGAFVLAALVLAVVGIYQSGHGHHAWTDRRILDGNGVHLSLADTVSLAVAACSVVAFAAAFRKH